MGLREHTGTCVIARPPAEVWAVLADAAGYQDWNPEVTRIDGTIATGARIRAHVKLGSGVVRAVRLTVTELEPPSRMVWVAGMPFGLFTGTRTFTVSPAPEGSRFSLHLEMKGVMLPLILKSVGDRQPEVELFCASLKARVEAR